jgi:alpha-beta hydrolase superfamily lysophospholipase
LRAHPFYLQSGDEPVFAMAHEADSRISRDVAVLFCPPFGWDDMCSYRSRREWADHLASEGYCSLRLDLPGTGDSAGGPWDQGLSDTWTLALATGARWLTSEYPGARIVAIGIGLGGLIAWQAIASLRAPIDDLVLWATPARGRTLVRELRAFSRLSSAADEEDRDAGDLPPGALAVNGYVLSPQTVAALERLDLSELALPDTPNRRVLALGRDRSPVDERLRALLERSSMQVDLASGRGYAAMMIEPQESRPPLEVFQLVSSWLQTTSPPASTDSLPRQTADTSLTESEVQCSDVAELLTAYAPIGQMMSPTSGKTPLPNHKMPPSSQEMPYPTRGAYFPIRETPFTVRRKVREAGEAGELFGILCEPDSPQSERSEVTAILLNAGPQRRTGPNRMWVEAARRWAALGIATARVDLPGIGDSDGDASRYSDNAAFYNDDLVDQARVVMDHLEAQGLPSRFVLTGLCAGAYWSAHAALADERVVSVYLLNPRTLVWDAWKSTARRLHTTLELALKASTWQRVVRGEITLSKHLKNLRVLMRRVIGGPHRLAVNAHLATRARIRQPPTAVDAEQPRTTDDEVDRLLDRLRDRRTRVLMLFTGKEPLYRELQERGRLAMLQRWPNLELVVMGNSSDTHTLAPVWLQRQVNELLDTRIIREISPQSSPTPTISSAHQQASR